VVGALIAATFSSFTYLLVLALMQPFDPFGQEFIDLLSAQIPFLFLVAMLSGYLAEAWERERQRRFDAQRELEAFRRDRELARSIQELLLPTELPTLPGLDIGFRSRPAKAVGGDYYDVLQLPHDEVGFCVADVAGKSVPGLLRLPIFKSALRACAHVYRTPGHTLTRLNNILHPELQPEMFISMAYGTLDAHRRKLLYTNAGHVPALFYHAAEGTCELLQPPGIVLGVEPHAVYAEQRVELHPQDCLIFYTDGLLEATGLHGEEFGLERLQALLQDHPAQTAQELADHILSRLAEFEVGDKRDDVTILVVRRA
jgi:sigma-B regulation protein RsbU (phosphoserine phosphatase)